MKYKYTWRYQSTVLTWGRSHLSDYEWQICEIFTHACVYHRERESERAPNSGMTGRAFALLQEGRLFKPCCSKHVNGFISDLCYIQKTSLVYRGLSSSIFNPKHHVLINANDFVYWHMLKKSISAKLIFPHSCQSFMPLRVPLFLQSSHKINGAIKLYCELKSLQDEKDFGVFFLH